jgi:hypothetical protein
VIREFVEDRIVTDIGISAGTLDYRNPRRVLIGLILFVLGVIAVFSWSAVREEIETQSCNNKFWKFAIQSVEPEVYASRCGGCPNGLNLALCLSTGSFLLN